MTRPEYELVRDVICNAAGEAYSFPYGVLEEMNRLHKKLREHETRY